MTFFFKIYSRAPTADRRLYLRSGDDKPLVCHAITVRTGNLQACRTVFW